MAENEKVLEKIKEVFSSNVIDSWEDKGEGIVVVNEDIFYKVAEYIHSTSELDFAFMANMTVVDYLNDKPPYDTRFVAIYHFYSMEFGYRLRIKVPVPDVSKGLASVTGIWKSAGFFEREAFDMFGMHFRGHPDLRRIYMPDDWNGHPLRKDYPIMGYDDGDIDLENASTVHDLEASETALKKVDNLNLDDVVLNMGPHHPATHGVLRLVLLLDGEHIKASDVVLGYLHRGMEKLYENKTYDQIGPITDRLDYLTCVANNLSYVVAIERLMGIEVPRRAQYVRVIMAEFARISSHMIWLAAFAIDLGAITPIMYAFREREDIMDIFDMVLGGRLTCNAFVVGGLKEDIPDGFIEKVEAFVSTFPQKFTDYSTLLIGNRIILGRCRGIGTIDKKRAINWGYSGPNLRASGVPYDLRKVDPYSCYDEFDFEIPIGENGDSYDRFLVRMEEMLQSNRIIEQAIKKLPDGDYMADDSRVRRPDKKDVFNNVESLIQYCYIGMEGIIPQEGEVYSRTESPRGELGFYVASNGTNKPLRMYVKAPSFPAAASMVELWDGLMIADVVTIMGSIDFVLGELDK